MKTIVQTENIEGKTIPLREVIPVWFAVSSPLLGATSGFTGSMVCCLAQRVTTSRKPGRIDKS